MSGPPVQGGEGGRPGLPEEENRAELGAENNLTAPQAPEVPALNEARLEDVLGAVVDYLNMREEACIRELEVIHKVKREVTNYVFTRIERRAQARERRRRGRERGIEVQAAFPVDVSDRAIQYLMRQLNNRGIKYALMYINENKIAAIKFLSEAPRDAVSLARWAFKAASERPSASQPTNGKNGGERSGGARKGALAAERSIK